EKRGEFNTQEEEFIDYHLFGCDICQQVCPWNKKVKYLENSPFCSFDRWKNLDFESLKGISETAFSMLKERSPVKRAKLEGIRRNANAVIKNMKNDLKDFVIDSE
ncbi:hypothetical protein KKA14_13135, partial [bacterium]|nr:hypothetical protein [bacterium]